MSATSRTVQLPSIDSFKMPDRKGQSVSISLPWGETFTVTRGGGSYSDLASQSTKFEYAFTFDGGEKKGSFSAIGGLCGSFEDCYFPIVKKKQRQMTLKGRVGYSWRQKLDSVSFVYNAHGDKKYIVGVEVHHRVRYLETPIPFDLKESDRERLSFDTMEADIPESLHKELIKISQTLG